jgi:fatty acid desaturase
MTVIPADRGSDFAPLLRTVRDAGLLRPRRAHYAAIVAVDVGVFSLVWGALYMLGHSWWALFLAVPAAVFTTRIMFIGHDVGHGQVARTARMNRIVGYIAGDLLTGLGSRWWIEKHTRHHANPNVVGRDPDVGAGALVWTSDQARRRSSRVGLWAGRNQATLYFPMLLGEALNLKVSSFRAARGPRDILLLVGHTAGYLGGLVLILGPGRAAVFVAIHQALLGLHLGCAFAPNHKGMLMPDPADRQTDFLRKQVLTSRNVSGGRAVTWFLGGLNYQIEHHLFPSVTRPSLRATQVMVRSHCSALEIPYAEASLRDSMGLTLRHLHAVGRPSAVES